MTASTSVLLQLSLRIHQSGLNPHPISLITPHTLTVQQVRQCALDLQIHILQLHLVFLYLAENTLINHSWQ